MRQHLQASLWFAISLVAFSVHARGSADYIVAVRRAGVVEFLNAATLKSVSRIIIDIPEKGGGLNGVFANPDGRTIYLEGPIGTDAVHMNSCCGLYSIDLATAEMRSEAGTLGSRSRRKFVSAGPGLLATLPVSADGSIERGAEVRVPELSPVAGCLEKPIVKTLRVKDRLLVYEVFGSKLDRRDKCVDVPGGAWLADSATGELSRLVSPALHFWELLPNRSGSEIFGVTVESSRGQAASRLVRIDARTGQLLQSRDLASDYWWISAASLNTVPAGSLSIELPPGRQ